MKIKVSEATNIQLDWMVAKCEGRTVTNYHGGAVWVKGRHEFFPSEDLEGYDFVFSAHCSWEIAGEIIEKHRIEIKPVYSGWVAFLGHTCFALGENPRIAAMRCFVSSKLGDEVEIPEELK